MPDPTLSIVIVSWNVCDLLAACLASLPSDAEVIVVDNASADGSAAMVAADYPAVRLISNADNRGFARANNQGLAEATGRYVLFLNPDTVAQDGAIPGLVAFAEAEPSVGIVGPKLRYGDGTVQSSRRRFPAVVTALCESTPLEWHWRDNPGARRYRMEDRAYDSVQDVDWLVGAALLCRREMLEQIGGFDEGFFMYSEEPDLCRRAKAAGWRVVYFPGAVITHYEGKSSGQVTGERHRYFQASRVRYFRKHHGPLAAGFVRLAVLAMFAIEWLIEAMKRLLGSRRDLRKARMSAYAALIRSGLR